MPQICWFAILTSVILHLSQCTIYSEARDEYSFQTKRDIRDGRSQVSITDEPNFEWIDKLFNSSTAFLAGEETPVWIAEGSSPSNRVSYERLENGIVKKAVDYWESTGFESLTSGKSGSVHEPSRLDENLRYWAAENSSAPEAEVFYPSILIMMDYKAYWPQEKEQQQELIYKRILYAMAFWNGVDLQFRHVQGQKVRFRIAGIIIGQNKEATPYLRKHEGRWGLVMRQALPSMLDYWREVAQYNRDFPTDAYHIIATLTDAHLSPGTSPEAYAISSPGPPCWFSSDRKGGLILPDDLAFGGIQVAVHETAHSMGAISHDGDSKECPEKQGNVLAPSVSGIGRIWSECSLRAISKALENRGSCMKKPLEFYRPGRPIHPILPGKLIRASLQCKQRGWEDGKVCWEKTTCDYLYCSNDHWYSQCENSGAPADGTTCGREKMCLDGKCVSNSGIFFVSGRSY